MNYSHEVENMCTVKKGPHHGPAPIPEEGKWVKSYQISDISGLYPRRGLVRSPAGRLQADPERQGRHHRGSPGGDPRLLRHDPLRRYGRRDPARQDHSGGLNTDLVCDAINVAMRELFLQMVYGRSQTAFSEDGLPIGASLEDLGKGLRSQVGTMFSTGSRASATWRWPKATS